MIARLHKGKGVIFMSKKKIFKILGIILLSSYIKIELLLLFHIILMFIISIILYTILNKSGVKEYKKINV